MEIKPNKFNTPLNQPAASSSAGEVTSASLNIGSEQIELKKKTIKQKILDDLIELFRGKTNNDEEFAEMLSEDMLEAFKEVERRQSKQK